MGRTVRRLEAVLNSGQPDQIYSLISREASEEERQQVSRAVVAVMSRMEEGSHYYVRSDIGRGAVVPTVPGRVSLQITGTYIKDGEDDHNEAVRLELEAVEDRQRRRWVLRHLVFAGSAPTPQESQPGWPWATTTFIGLGLVGLGAWWARRRRRRQGSVQQA